MRRAFQLGAGLALALLLTTCTDRNLTGPARPGFAALNFAAWATRQAGEAPVPVESLEIRLQRPSDLAPALDTIFGFDPDTLQGDSAAVRLNVDLRQSAEDFLLTVRAFGRGVDWYLATATVRITAGATTPVAPLVRYVGPGANAARVAMFPANVSVVGGVPVPLQAKVYNAAGDTIPNVPIGYRLDNPTRGTIAYPTPFTATFTPADTVRDSVRVVAEIPTHLRDSAFLRIRPPPAQLAKISGDNQAGFVGGPLPALLVVRVLDRLGGGFLGDTVRWTVLAGTATLSAATTVTDDTGYATVAVTPTAIGPLAVQAERPGLTGSPVAFAATATAGTVYTVTISPKVDTVQRGATRQYTVVLKDSLGNTVNAAATWTSTLTGVATINSSGLATALAGDSTRIIAASGGRADTARLYVRVLRTVTVTPADTVITAVGDSLLLQVALRDNFGATRTGLDTVRFVSASPTIAAVNRLTGRVTITGPGNAVVLATDSTPGVAGPRAQGAATLRVNQVTAGIVNRPRAPDSVVVGVTGQTQIVASAVDRNNYPIPNKTLGWVSRLPSIATVTTTGVVSGVALGSTFVVDSVVDSAGVFKDSTKVVVSPAPPKLIQWAFDSTSVGNGGNISVALSITQPYGLGPLLVKIASSDTTIAKPSSKTATISTGASGTSVVINGLRSGRVVLTATDSTGGGYSLDTMVVAVVSTIDFREIAYPGYRQTNFYVNQNETHQAQVWLSDPAPAGGLGITFVYGRAGTSVVTPSPAIIPAGQLAADVTFQGLAPGRDSVVPTSGGYVGKFSYVDVAPDSLRLYIPYYYYYATPYLGVGQTFQPYVQFTYAMDHPLVVSTRLARGLGTTPDTVTIPTGSTYRYFDVVARTAGPDTLVVSAPGWITARGAVVFTTPRLQLTGTTSLVAGAPNGYWYAYTQDSLAIGHAVVDSVAVTVVSRNPAAVAIDTALTYVLPGNSNTPARYSLRPLPTAGGDSAWIVATATAPGITYRPDSMKVYVTRPTLNFAVSYPYDFRTGIGTIFQSAGYVNIPYARPDTFTVLFGHSRRGIVSGPDSVRIPKGQTYAYFDVRGDTIGVDTIRVDTTRTTGYVVQGSPQVFRVDPLHVRPYNYYGGATLYTISRPQVANAIAVDSVTGYARPLVAPLVVNMSSSNPAALTLDSAQVTIDSGQYISRVDTMRIVGIVDSARIRTQATRSSADSSGFIRVIATPLTLSISYPYTVGRGLVLQNNRVYLPDLPRDTVTVALTHSSPSVATLSKTTVKIPPSVSYSETFDIAALDSTGRDTITASATGFVTTTAVIAPERSRIDVSNVGANHLTTEPPQYVYTYLRTFSGYSLNAAAPVVFTIQSTDSTVIRIDSAGVVFRGDSAADTVSAGLYYAYFKIRYAGSGTARVRVSATGFDKDSTELVTVTGPSLYFGYNPVTVGVNQIFQNQYVYTSNAVTGSPLVVRLTRSDSLAPAASQVFGLSAVGDSVVIAVGSNSAYFNITGKNPGAVRLIARAAGYSEATADVSVGTPQLLVPSTLNLYVGAAPTSVYVYTQDQGGNYRPVASPTVVTTSSSDATVATADSATLTIATGANSATTGVRGLQKGTTAIIFSSPSYKPDTIAVSVDTGQLTLGSPPNGLGPGQVAQNAMYVQIPFTTPAALTVSLASSNTGILTVPSSVTIPANNSYVYFNVTGVGVGTATVSATAAGVKPATPVGVTIGQPKLLVSLPANVNVGQTNTITVYAQDANNISRNVTADLTVTLASSDAANTTFGATTITIPAGSSSAQTTVTFATAKSYTITASATGYTDGTANSNATGALVRMQSGNVFSPSSVTITRGQYVTWRNDDSINHTSTSDTGVSPAWDTGTRTPGQTSTVYFGTAGTFTYHCNIHGAAMSGTVVVNP